MAFGLLSTDDTVRREDLLDLITDVSPDANPLSTMLGTTTASDTIHQWPEDYLSRPSSVAASVEGAQATYSDLAQPVRRSNLTHIITKTFRVSGTEGAIDAAGMADPLNYQADKNLRDWKNSLEYNLLNSTLVSGASGTAAKMAGIDAVTTSHYTARNSGTSLSETEFNAMVKESWDDVSQEDVFDMVLVPFGLKQKISTFTAGILRTVDASDKRLTRPVQVYESDGGIHRIFAHKDVRSAAATPGPTFIGLKEDKWKIAYLKGRKPKREMLAKDGDRENGQIVGEATLEYRGERTSVRRTGYAVGG